MNIYLKHASVLKNECIENLIANAEKNKISYFADLTFGGGGHSFEFLYRDPSFKVISTGQDPDAYHNGQKRIEEESMGNRIKLLNMNFIQFPQWVNSNGSDVLKEGGFQGILLDLGVSSHHYDEGKRGFSFRFDAPLDMRMNYHSNEFLSAEEVVNTYSEDRLIEIFQEYGEEKFSKRIAQKICEERKVKRIVTTKELENIVFHAYPKEFRYGRTNPSTKVFQALRLEVNQELSVLSDVIFQLVGLLRVGGRLGIISFHSLEDRIVKHQFKVASSNLDYPTEIITKKPIIPSPEELLNNSRSRSAKLRVLERVEQKKQKNKYKNDFV